MKNKVMAACASNANRWADARHSDVIMTDYGVRRKFEVKNIEKFWAYVGGVKFKHQNNMDEFDFPVETLNKMLTVHSEYMLGLIAEYENAAQQSVQPTRASERV